MELSNNIKAILAYIGIILIVFGAFIFIVFNKDVLFISSSLILNGLLILFVPKIVLKEK